MHRLYLAAGAGVLVGSVVTYLVAKTRFEKLLEEEVESVKEFYDIRHKSVTTDLDAARSSLSRYEERDNLVIQNAREHEEQNEETVVVDLETSEAIIDKESYASGYSKYHGKFDLSAKLSEIEVKKSIDTSFDEDDDTAWANVVEEEVIPEDEQGDRPTGIEVISEDEYYEGDYDKYESVFMMYYPKTGILTTEDEEVIENKKAILGDRGLRNLIKFDFEGDTLYVRNHNRLSQYEVFVVDQ